MLLARHVAQEDLVCGIEKSLAQGGAMARIRDPIRFSEHFGVDQVVLADMNVFDPLLNVDTPLFIQPLLLDDSGHDEFSNGAQESIRTHFGDLIRLLKARKKPGDIADREIRRRMTYREIAGTCLGYGGSSIHGSAMGDGLRQKIMSTASQIVELGVDDPELFLLLPLLEEGVGADRISDMITNIVLKDLCGFTARVSEEIGVACEEFEINGTGWLLPRNPCEQKPQPVFLVASDVLRDLPVASDWSEIADMAAKNGEIREKINAHIGDIWNRHVRADREQLRRNTMRSREAIEALIELVRTAKAIPYDLNKDSEGLVRWTRVLGDVAENEPLPLKLPPKPTRDQVFDVVMEIVRQFKHLVEECGLWKSLWDSERRLPEKAAQRLFFAVAHSYCKANNLDLTPEAETGSGPVDFKVSSGFDGRVLVEAKLSSNTKLVRGYTKQLEAYKAGEETGAAVYLVIDVGSMSKKDQALTRERNRLGVAGDEYSELVFVDGLPKKSASKR